MYASQTGVSPSPQDLSLEDLYGLLEHEETDCVLADGTPGCRGRGCPLKDGLAWTAGFIDDPCRCGNGSRPTKSTTRCVNCGKKTRFAVNVAGLDVAVFDIDHVTEVQRDVMCEKLEGVELLLHTTHTHAPPHDNNFRLVLPFTRTITPAEWTQIWFVLGRKFDLNPDKATKDPARLAFLPRALRGKPFLNIRQEGALLNPDDLLKENIVHSRQVQRAPRELTVQPEGIDLADLKGFLKRYDPDDNDPAFAEENQKGAVIRRVLAGEALAQKGSRGLTTLRAGTLVGKLVPIYTSVDAAMEILRPAISKVPEFEDDNVATDSFEAWIANAKRGFEGAQAEKAAKLADEDTASGMLVAVMERKKAAQWKMGPDSIPASVQAPTLSQGVVPPPPPSVEVTDDRDDVGEWRLKKLVTIVDKQGNPHPKNTAANIGVVLQNHQAWKGKLKFNTMTQEPEAHGGPLQKDEREADRLVMSIRNWLCFNEEIDQPLFEVRDHIDHIARGNSYDPIKSYLATLKHDGEARIGSWLIDYCGARLVDDNGVDVTKYVRMVGEKWLMAGAARGLYPGCKADNVLVFEGEQYAGKSMMLDVLGGRWFADTQLDLANKSTYELASKSWIIELSELASMKRGETEAQKSFFSRRIDKYRLSYARRTGEFPRRCIFAGTTNEKEYLLDLTGNRRFWCVWCDIFDIPGLRRVRDQLWAEAVEKVRAGENCSNCVSTQDRCSEHRWWLDNEQTALAELVSKTRMKDEYKEDIRAWWLNKEPEKRPPQLTIRDVLVHVLELKMDRKVQLQAAIGRSLIALGFVKKNPRGKDGRGWIYVPTDALRKAPRERISALSLKDMVDEAKATQPMPEVKQ